MRQSLDIYDIKPEGMIAYYRYNGLHFNDKMAKWATEQMYRLEQGGTKRKTDPWTKEQVEKMLDNYGIKLQNKVLADHVYVANMAKTDFYGRSLRDEQSLAQFIKDTIDDDDQPDGFIFNRFYADCILKGLPIPWDDMI